MHSDDIRDLDVLVQLDVARSELADPRDLVALAADDSDEVHLTLAELGHLPAEAVELLAQHPDEEVRAMLARNRGLAPGPAALREALLVEDPSSWVRSELLELELSVPMRTRVLAGLQLADVLHPQDWMPEDLLRRLVAEAGDDEHLRGRAVHCLPSDGRVLRELARSPSAEVRSEVAANPVLPVDLCRRLAADEDAFVRQCAVRAELGPSLLAVLADDADGGVRGATARACRELLELPSSGQAARERAAALLARLARDPDEWVRTEVALHPALHGLLVDDDSDHVRWRLAATATDPLLLRRLAERPDPELEVVPSIAGNAATPVPLLRALHDRLLAQWAASSGLRGDEEPDEGSADGLALPVAQALAALVSNPALPDELVLPLLLHPAPAVSGAALHRVPHDPRVVPARAVRRRARRGLLWQLLGRTGAQVDDPAVRAAALALLPTAAGSVADLAAVVDR